MAQDDATEALRQRLIEFGTPASMRARDELRQAVSAYVAEKKALGWPPERVIVGLKYAPGQDNGDMRRWSE